MSDVSINIVSQFLGQKAFDKAGSSAEKLAKNVKRALIGVGFEEFARRSVMAFAANEKEMAALTKTLGNLGLEMQNASVASYLDKLALATGALKSDLVPAFQQLATTTKDTADATTLLNLAMDVSAGSTNSLDSVVNALTKAYAGNVAGLGKLNVGIDKTMLATGDLQQIVAYLNTTFEGQSATAAETFANRLLRIRTAVEDAQEAFGKGLVDSLTILSNSQSIEELQTKIINFGTTAGNAFKTMAGFIKENETALKNLSSLLVGLYVGSKITAGIYLAIGAFKALTATLVILRNTSLGAAIAQMAVLNPIGAVAYGAALVGVIAVTIKAVDLLADKYNKLADAADPERFNNAATAFDKGFGATAVKLVNYSKKLTAEELKQIKAKKLKLAIDKANLALGKGADVFDIEKIQLAAAELNLAQQIGKTTTQGQLLAITNDLQRLEIKQSMLALDEAIATGDITAITRATARLNEDLKIFGTLSNQKIKLNEIEKILEGLVPKSLIDLTNLNEAIRLLDIINGGKTSPSGQPPVAPAGSTPALSRYGTPLGGGVGSTKMSNEYLQYLEDAESYMYGNLFANGGDPFGLNSKASSGTTVNMTNNFNGLMGDPNAHAETIDQLLIDAVQRGTLRPTL